MIDGIVGAVFYFAVILKCLIPVNELCYKRVNQSLESHFALDPRPRGAVGRQDSMTNRKSPHRHLQRIVWVLLLGMFTTLACDWSIDYGITCLQPIGSRLLAYTFEKYNGIPNNPGGFTSEDGGLTWQTGWSNRPDQPFEVQCNHAMPTQLSDPRDAQILYRFTPDGTVDRSEDGGQTWRREINSLALSEAEAIHYGDRSPMATGVKREPQDAVVDKSTGNVIVALGQAGAMVRTQDAQWRHVQVGPYVYEPLDGAKVAALLSGEFLLALAVPFLVAGAVFLLVSGWRWQHIGFGIPAWLLWLLLLFFSPVKNSHFFSAHDSLLVWILCLSVLIALVWGVSNFIWLDPLPRRAAALVGSCAVVSAFLFYAPYALWTWAKIPSYDTARSYALIAVVAVIAFTSYSLRRLLDQANLSKQNP